MVSLEKPYFFYPLLFICVSLDIFSSFVLGSPIFNSLLCLFCVACSNKISLLRLAILLCLLGIESFFFYDLWGIQLIYLIPLAFVAHFTRDKITHRMYHALFLVTFCFIAQLIIDFLLGINIFSIFTIIEFFINIVLTISLSLTYR